MKKEESNTKFYLIPTDLVRQLMNASQLAYEEGIKKENESDKIEKKHRSIGEYFITTFNLIFLHLYFYFLKIVSLFKYGLNKPKPDNLRATKRMWEEEIYYYFGHLPDIVESNSENTNDLTPLDFKLVFEYELGKIIGLPKDHSLIIELVNDLLKWVKRTQKIQTGWGFIEYNSGLVVISSDEVTLILTT